MANPTLLDMPIAVDGDKNTIPTTTTPTTGLLSQQYGWRDINSMPVTQGGKAPNRKDFNGVFNLLSNILFYAQKGWQFEWDSSQAYYAGCIVKDTSDGKMYMCLNDVTSTTAPHSDTTNWKLWDLSMLANYLPLSGGTMTGVPAVKMNNNTGVLQLMGGDNRIPNSCGRMNLFGGQNSAMVDVYSLAGACEFLAYNGSAGADFFLTANGDFILRPDLNDVSKMYDVGGSAIVAINLAENGYIKYAKGLIYQWGRANAIGSGVQTVNYNINFPTGCKNLQVRESDNRLVNVVTKADKISINNQTGYDLNFDWFAVGY